MADHEWHWIHGVNPEPWTAPNVAVGRKNGKPFPLVYASAALKSYKEAVREVLDGRPTLIFDPGTPIELEFYFWRQLPDYATDRDRRARKHEVDATNCQKALEDALQGILFENDRDVKRVLSEMREQTFETVPLIGIRVGLWSGPSELGVVPPAPSELTPDMSDRSDLPANGVQNVEEYF